MNHEPQEDAIGVGLYAGPCRYCGKWVNFKPQEVAITLQSRVPLLDANVWSSDGSLFHEGEIGKTYEVKAVVSGMELEFTYLFEEVLEPCTAEDDYQKQVDEWVKNHP